MKKIKLTEAISTTNAVPRNIFRSIELFKRLGVPWTERLSLKRTSASLTLPVNVLDWLLVPELVKQQGS